MERKLKKMQRQWTGKNVDLALLSERVEDFFRNRGFLTEKNESAGEYTILWAPPRVGIRRDAMKAGVFGKPNDFVVEIIASERTRGSIRLGMLTKLFGGGYLVVRGLRAKEALEKLEREFWAYVEEKVAQLAGSAEHARP
ncbi:MAG: hypothetical protein OEX76_01690 [Candidatus Bathyarchaeota archaeon]|nr:hypothetical protein [Candidatus Bathyarchaeota archaeon]MDH5713314.1 hypothetical protein [Candidatus Bathyarchaeota archaeon]